jgi:hypothetical protein
MNYPNDPTSRPQHRPSRPHLSVGAFFLGTELSDPVCLISLNNPKTKPAPVADTEPIDPATAAVVAAMLAQLEADR